MDRYSIILKKSVEEEKEKSDQHIGIHILTGDILGGPKRDSSASLQGREITGFREKLENRERQSYKDLPPKPRPKPGHTSWGLKGLKILGE